MTVDEVAAIIGATPGIAEGFVQHYSGLHKNPKAVRNTGGGWQSSHAPARHFRVVLYHDDRAYDASAGKVKGKMADVEKPTLREAVSTAFEQIGVPLPPELFFDAED